MCDVKIREFEITWNWGQDWGTYSKGKITLVKRVTSNKIVQKIKPGPAPEKVRPLEKVWRKSVTYTVVACWGKGLLFYISSWYLPWPGWGVEVLIGRHVDRPGLYSWAPEWDVKKLIEAGCIRKSCLLPSSWLMVAVDSARCHSIMIGCVGDYIGPMVVWTSL